MAELRFETSYSAHFKRGSPNPTLNRSGLDRAWEVRAEPTSSRFLTQGTPYTKDLTPQPVNHFQNVDKLLGWFISALPLNSLCGSEYSIFLIDFPR